MLTLSVPTAVAEMYPPARASIEQRPGDAPPRPPAISGQCWADVVSNLSSVLADERDLAEVADAPQQGRSVRFEQQEGRSRESSSDDESRGGDTAASSTEDDIARGELTAVAARRKERAQPENRVAGDMHPPKPPADRNTKAEVGNVALMIGNWGERSEKQKV